MALGETSETCTRLVCGVVRPDFGEKQAAEHRRRASAALLGRSAEVPGGSSLPRLSSV